MSNSTISVETCCGPVLVHADCRGMIINTVDRDEYDLRGLPVPTFALDIGASFGPVTLLMRTLWPECEILAFEPNPERARLWRQNVGHLPGVRLIEAGLIYGEHPRIQQMRASFAKRGWAMTTLAESVDRVPDMVKIDTEGGEIGTLEEMRALWRVPHIRGEWHGEEGLKAVALLGLTHHVEIKPPRGGPWDLFKATLNS